MNDVHRGGDVGKSITVGSEILPISTLNGTYKSFKNPAKKKSKRERKKTTKNDVSADQGKLHDDEKAIFSG